MTRTLAALMLLGGCGGIAAGCATLSSAGRLSAHPRVAFAPVEVLLTLRLDHSQTLEERFYCPEVAWDYGDGSASHHVEDCPPWSAGAPAVDRFTSRHLYKRGGTYLVRAALLRAGERLLLEEVVLVIRPGLGEPGLVDVN